jgi:uncharacterized membrane protein/nitrite reductase/ring-hydroxylating ferredoxin subunit
MPAGSTTIPGNIAISSKAASAMKTIASIKSHSLHPILIPFPIAFLTATVVCNVIGWWSGNVDWCRTGAWSSVAGIATAVLAAVPGFIDYFLSVPPASSAKRRATWHLSVNLGAVALFAVAWLFRDDGAATRPTLALVALEVAGLLLLMMGGWLGGTLVHRNFIGPEHRYANAGKWREQQLSGRAGESIRVCRADEFKADQMRLLHIDGKRVVLCRTESGFAAFQDHCTHRGASLADGVTMCGRVQCLWHGSQFDVHTGDVKAGPAEKPIRIYETETRDGDVYVKYSDS